MSNSSLLELAVAAGLSVQWLDYRGQLRTVDDETLKYTLESLGLPSQTPAQLAESLAQLRAEAAELRTLMTVDCDSLLTVPALLTGRPLFWRDEESGVEFTAASSADMEHVVAPSLPGYYLLAAGSQAVRVAVAPRNALPAHIAGQRRWGLSAQLYSLPRPGDHGIGDFTSLKHLAEWAARQGADALAMSPAHALFSADLGRYSPYSPSSRLFFNTLYGDPASLDSNSLPIFSTALSPLIDWPASAAIRLQQLRLAFERFKPLLASQSPLGLDFSRFVTDGGDRLMEHARFEVLSAHSRSEGGSTTWREWRPGFRDPESPEVAEFAATHGEEIQFHLFAQWLADRNLGEAQQAALDEGMTIGLIGDLAVGTDSGGSHSWSLQDGMLRGLSVGAPPDLMATQGQNWGLTTFSPRHLRTSGFAPFIELLRANLRRVGGLRIDHILGLRRLWLAPDGQQASRGVYVEYPFGDLLRLLRLEAWRRHALLIGEDLGTVPAGFREQLHASGILGMQVLWFERDHGFFVEPARWSGHAVATTTTHDVPSIARWWRGGDLDWRKQAGQFSSDAEEEIEQVARAADRSALWGALQHQHLVAAEAPPPEQAQQIVDATIAFVASTPAPLVMVPMEDLLGVTEQPNVPGTVDEHPNWRRRLPVAVSALDTHAKASHRTASLRAQRPKQ